MSNLKPAGNLTEKQAFETLVSIENVIGEQLSVYERKENIYDEVEATPDPTSEGMMIVKFEDKDRRFALGRGSSKNHGKYALAKVVAKRTQEYDLTKRGGQKGVVVAGAVRLRLYNAA